MLAPGTILDGRYEVLAPLAEGGMGAVFRARRLLLGDEVAVKIVRAEYAADQSVRERFLRESRLCAQLRHPNIVSIFDFNLDGEGRPFLVMELLSGPSLREEMSSRRDAILDRPRCWRSSCRSAARCSSRTSTASSIAT